MSEFETNYRLLKLEVEVSTLLAILIERKLTTFSEFESVMNMLKEDTKIKEQFDQLEYSINVTKMIKKDKLTEEDEKYIREKNTWDKKEDIEEFIDNIKMMDVIQSMVDAVKGRNDDEKS